MSRMKKTILGIMLAFVMTAGCIVCQLNAFPSYAAMTNRIAFGDPSAKVGEEFTVTMKIYALDNSGKLGSANITVNYDPNYVEFVSGDNAQGGAGTLVVKGQTTQGTEWDYAFKFKALAAGTTTMSVDDSATEIYDTDAKAGSFVEHKGTSTITITGEATAGVDASLASLKISPGILTPEFNPDITEYSVTVGDDCEKITVSAPTKDTQAKVVITGNSNLAVGKSDITCKVTAQDGSTTKTYTIHVDKQQGVETPTQKADGAALSSQTANVGGKDYDVAETFDDALLPEGFESTQIDFHGKTVQAAKSTDKDITILYLIDSTGTADFFVYDVKNDTWSAFAQLNVVQKSFTIMPVGDDSIIPEGLIDQTLELNGKKVRGWISESDDNAEYCVVYAMNQDGETGFYRYDLKEKTIQRYFAEKVVAPVPDDIEEDPDTIDKYNELLDDYNKRGYLLFGSIVIIIILLVAVLVIALASSRKPKEKKSSKKPEKRKSEPQRQPARRERVSYDLEDDSPVSGLTTTGVQRDPRETGGYRTRQERGLPELTDEEKYLRGDEDDDDFTTIDL